MGNKKRYIMFLRLNEVKKQWIIAWGEIAEASSITIGHSKNNYRRSLMVLVTLVVIMLSTGFELLKTYTNMIEDGIKRSDGKLVQLRKCVSLSNEYINDVATEYIVMKKYRPSRIVEDWGNKAVILELYCIQSRLFCKNSSDDGFKYLMIVVEKKCTVETLMNDITGQSGWTYGVILEQDNAKTRSAWQKLASQKAEEELLQSSEDVRREERMQQCCGQPIGEYSGGSFSFFKVVRVKSILIFEVDRWNSNVSFYFYGSSNLEAVLVVSFKQVVLSREYKENLRKEYNYGQINRMLVYLVQFVISGECNRCELKDSKVSSFGFRTMNTSNAAGEQLEIRVWWSQRVSLCTVSKYGLN